MKLLKILFYFLLSSQLYAQTRVVSAYNISPVSPIQLPPSEAWVKLTCHGVISPRYSWPAYEKPIMVAHVKVNAGAAFPKYEDLRDNNSDFMKALTRTCTERRWNKMEFGSWSGNWLDWGTDYAFSRLEVGEEFVYNQNACRAVGKPCERLSQCCGYANRSASCNLSMKTCESNLISTNTSVPSSL